jgi:hypothetical protein
MHILAAHFGFAHYVVHDHTTLRVTHTACYPHCVLPTLRVTHTTLYTLQK